MGEQWGLSKRNAPLEVGLSESKCSHRLCPPIPCAQMKGMRKSFFYPLTASIEKRGMGLCPMFTHDPFRTRMIERWNLLVPHTPLEVGLPKGKCSHRLCLALLCT